MLSSLILLQSRRLLSHQDGLEFPHLHVYIHSSEYRDQEGEAQYDCIHQIVLLLLLRQQYPEVYDDDLFR